jgi:hypothetical protein
MKYALGLLFEFKYYKNPANMKIFVDNQLIDDIDLTEDINSTINLSPATLCKTLPVYKKRFYDALHVGMDYPIKFPEKIFLYTLDETILQNSIEIEITNNNTNYSNSFMTKWSSFTFTDIFLIPTYYLNLKNYITFYEKQLNERQLPNYNSAKHNNLKWPNENRIVKNGQFVQNEDNHIETHRWKWTRGGSFSFKLPIIEYIHEKGLKMLGPINYEQLLEKEKRHLYQSDICPLYFNHFNLINTQNETA